MTELPDGSGCFTATIMSNEEAMALPLKDRPLNHRISSEMYHATFQHIGEASMCWNPRPSTEVFASEQASDVAVRLCFKIANEVESKTALLREAFDAAKAYIDSSVCDPDTTAEMWKAYKAYEAACASLAGRAAGAGVGLEPPAADKGHNKKAQRACGEKDA